MSKQQVAFLNLRQQKIPFYSIVSFFILKKKTSLKIPIRFGIGKHYYLSTPIPTRRHIEIRPIGLFKY